LAQLRAYTSGHLALDSAEERARINVIRLALGGEENDIEDYLTRGQSKIDASDEMDAILAQFSDKGEDQ